jgi:hypothetical protein
VYPILPEVLYITHLKEGILNDISLIDKASGIYSIFFSFGCIIAVIITNLIVT